MGGNKLEIIFSGVGGQGIVVAGEILGKAVVEYAGKNAVSTSEYGVETRGTFTKSSVIISDSEIYYTDAIEPNYVVCLASVAYEKYIKELNENSILIYDSSLINQELSSKCKQIGFPISKIAFELGSEKAVNMVSLGIIIGITNIVDIKNIEKVLNEKFKDKERALKINSNAVNSGYDIVVKFKLK